MNMTRENKLALVVGFGLVLFVGILISDHFSTARNQESADIRTGRLIDPLVQSRHDNAHLIELPVARPSDDARRGTPPLAMNTGQIVAEDPPKQSEVTDRRVEQLPSGNGIPRIVMGRDNNDSRIDVGRTESSVPFVFHHVQAGESLIAIARRHYGDESLARELARFNEIDNPNSIRVGHRLRIPDAAALRGGQAASSSTATPASGTPAQARPQQVYTSYTVKRGDTLSEISQELLGTARRWREIYEMNRDVIRDPDNLTAGTELRIPRPGR